MACVGASILPQLVEHQKKQKQNKVQRGTRATILHLDSNYNFFIRNTVL